MHALHLLTGLLPRWRFRALAGALANLAVALGPVVASVSCAQLGPDADAGGRQSRLASPSATDGRPGVSQGPLSQQAKQLLRRIESTLLCAKPAPTAPEDRRAQLLELILDDALANGPLELDELQRLLVAVVSPSPGAPDDRAKRFGYEARYARLPLLELADLVAAKIQSPGHPRLLGTLFQKLGAAEVSFASRRVELAVRWHLVRQLPALRDWRERPLRRLALGWVQGLDLAVTLGDQNLEDLRQLPRLQSLTVEVGLEASVEALVRVAPLLGQLHTLQVSTKNFPRRAALQELAPLGRLANIKTLGLTTSFWSLNGGPHPGTIWRKLPELFPHVETVIFYDTWASAENLRKHAGSLNNNLSLALQAIARMPKVHTLEVVSSVLGRQIDALPPGLRFPTVRLIAPSFMGVPMDDPPLEISSLSRPFGRARSLTLIGFEVTDSGRFWWHNFPDVHAKTDWEELSLLRCRAKGSTAQKPLLVRVWPKAEPNLTRLDIRDSRYLAVEPESRMVLALRRPESIVQAVLHKRHQDLLDQSTVEFQVLKDFIDGP